MTNNHKISTSFDGSELLSKISWLSIGFGLLCFITILFTGSKSIVSEKVFERNGGEISVETTSDNTIYKVKVHQRLFPNSWSVVNVTVLNEKRVELFTVAGSLWAESGYEDGYPWNESDLDFDADFTLYDKGKYYFLFETELSEDPSKIDKMSIVLWEKGSSSIPFVFAGFVSIILGFLLLVFKNNITSFF